MEELDIKKSKLLKKIKDLNVILNDDFIKKNGYKYSSISKKNDRNIKVFSLFTIFDLPVVIILLPFVSSTLRIILLTSLWFSFLSVKINYRANNEFKRKCKNIELYDLYYKDEKVSDDIIIRDIELAREELLKLEEKEYDYTNDNYNFNNYIELKRKVLVKRK